MLLVDDLLLAPFTSLLWVFKEIHEAVQQETAGEAEAVTRSLSELYMKLETGTITEQEFDEAEAQLLDRLDAIRDREEGLAEEGEEGGEEDQEEDQEEEEEEDEEEFEDEEEQEEGTLVASFLPNVAAKV